MKYKKLIRNQRISKGYTQESFSRVIGCTKDYYSKIERGKSIPNVYLGLTIAKELSIDPYKAWF